MTAAAFCSGVKFVIQIFTEIDHGYVNPVSVTHRQSIDRSFSNARTWYGEPGGFYAQPMASFNEYMTWGAMLLYVRENYPPVRFKLAREDTSRIMMDERRFVAFEDFFAALLGIYERRAPHENLAGLFPKILAWAAGHQGQETKKMELEPQR